MEIKIKYLADIEKIQHIKKGDWIDLRAAEDVVMYAGESKLIPLGIAMQLPEGYEAIILFVIQMRGVRYFTPNYETHERFGNALKSAKDAGVKILAYDCDVEERSMTVRSSVDVRL